jgi:hypothetical protein
MRNVQIMDGADNASHSVYAVSDGDLSVLFPAGTDIDFAGDLTTRIGLPEASRILSPLWGNELDQAKICGIQGTIIYELLDKRLYFPDRRSTELEHRHSNAYRWLDVKEETVWHEAHLNIQVFDERAESDYPVFAATRSEFELIFPSGADMEFETTCYEGLDRSAVTRSFIAYSDVASQSRAPQESTALFSEGMSAESPSTPPNDAAKRFLSRPCGRECRVAATRDQPQRIFISSTTLCVS